MQARLQEALTRVLTEGGRDVLGQPARFRNMLADALGDDVSSLRSEQQSAVRLVAGGGQGLVDGSLDRSAKLSLLTAGRGEPTPTVVDAFDSAATALGWIERPVDPTRVVDDDDTATAPVPSLRADAPVVLARKRPRRGRLMAAAAAAGAFVLMAGGGMAGQRETPSFESAAAAQAPSDETAAPTSTEPSVDPASDGASDNGSAESPDPSSTEEPQASPDPQVLPPSGTDDDGPSFDGRGNSGVTHGDPYPRPVVNLRADTDLLTVGDYTTLSASSQYASGYRWLDPTGQCTDSAPLCTVTCTTPFETVTIGLVGLGLGGESAPSFVSIFCIDEPPLPPDLPPDFPPPPEPPY